MENEVGSAVKYKPFGFTEDENEAIKFCSKGKTLTSKDCWAVYGMMKEFKYKELDRI